MAALTKEQLYSTASYQQKNLQGISFSSCPPHELCGITLFYKDLSGWDLTGQDLTNAYFRKATLTDANLTGAILTGANLNDTTSHGFTQEQLYSTASYQEKNLQGVGLVSNDLSGWDLHGQDLTNASFFGSNLNGTNFAGADLRGADSELVAAIVRNTIHPNGTILNLDLAGGDELRIRDYNSDSESDPPRPPIPITVNDQFAMSDGGVLRLVFESDPWDSVVSFEPGIPVQLGGTLLLTFADDTNMPQIGRTLRIFDWTGVTPTGTFAVASPYMWDLSRLYTTGEVTLTAIPEPAFLAVAATAFLSLSCAHWRQLKRK